MSCGTCGLQAGDTMQGDTGVPAGAPSGGRPRCPHCQAFISQEGAPCHNPRCPGRAAATPPDTWPARLRQPAIRGLTAALRDQDQRVRTQAIFALAALAGEQAIPSLATEFAASSPAHVHIRAACAQALGQPGWTAALPTLAQALQPHSDLNVRMAAAEALANIGGPEALPLLTTALHDDSPSVRLPAIEALATHDPRAAVPLLQATLQHEDWPTARFAAADILTHLDDAQAVPAITAALTTLLQSPGDQVEQTRLAALFIRLLGQVATPPTTATLRPLLTHPSPVVRLAAAQALAPQHDPEGLAVFQQSLAEVPKEDLEEMDWAHRQEEAVAALAAYPPGQAVPLLSALTAATQPGVALKAIAVLAIVGGDPARAHLTSLLAHADFAKRTRAAYALGQMGQPAALPDLQAAFQRAEDTERAELVWSICAIGSPSAQEFLVATMQTAAPLVRRTAAETLGRLPHPPIPAVLPTLVTTLNDEWAPPALRTAAADSLCRWPDPTVLPTLRAMLQHPQHGIRLQALTALGQRADPAAFPLLVPLLTDDRLAPHVMAALVQTGGSQSLPLLHQEMAAYLTISRQRRQAVITQLGRLGTAEALQPLADLLHATTSPSVHHLDDHAAARREAAAALGAAPPRCALPLLTTALQDRDPAVRLAAATALQQLAAPATADFP